MGHKPRARLGLADEWRRWVAEALHGGATPGLVVAELVASGAPRRLAEAEVDTIATAMVSLSGRLRRAELLLDLASSLARMRQLERRSLCDRTTFAQRYLATQTPVVFEDIGSVLGIVGRWTPRYLADRAGDRVVRVSAGRNADPRHYVHPERDYTEMPLEELVARIEAADTKNDIYLVSRNRALEGPLGMLLEDIVGVPGFLRQEAWDRAVSLWMGPAGTHTPLHHDTSHILFCQIHGTKRVRLVSAIEPGLLFGPTHATFYSNVTPEDVGARVYEIEMTPGDGLYIPLGFWHQVDSLTPSISLSFTGFLDAGPRDGYRPGEAYLPPGPL